MHRRNGAVLLVLGALALTGCSAHANADPGPRRPAGTGLEAAADTRSPLPGNPSGSTASPSAPATGAAGSLIPVPSPSATGSAAPGTTPSGGGMSEDPRDGLLGNADVPAGFVPVAAAAGHSGKVNIGGGNFPGCPALEPMTTDDTTAAAVTYAKGAAGPYLTDAIVRFPAGGAKEAMNRLRGTVAACESFDQQLAGVSVRFRLAATQPPAGLGDESVGLRMTGTASVGISVTADIIAVRRGDYVIWLNDTAIGDTPAGLATSVAPAAAARCGRVLKGC
ncbi:hypothetical protein ABT297_38810 [Dactylosporangium sp. NPDC000555]|uniref:hypothetical protein n=1 Tax=Dactylosporangium sp. NPDC000555 TaxID=3154260 RepID=UPI003327503B